MSPYAKLVGELDSPHVPKAPSASFVAVLLALDELGRSYAYELGRRSGVDNGGVIRLLVRMRRLELVDLEPRSLGAASRGLPRKYYRITKAGRGLAGQLREAGAA